MNQAKSLVQYIKDSKNEIKKVTWPNKKEFKQHTILVIGISLATAGFLGIVDYVLTQIVGKII